MELRRKVGMGRMSVAGLLGKKEVIKATMEYVHMTGRFVEKEKRSEMGQTQLGDMMETPERIGGTQRVI